MKQIWLAGLTRLKSAELLSLEQELAAECQRVMALTLKVLEGEPLQRRFLQRQLTTMWENQSRFIHRLSQSSPTAAQASLGFWQQMAELAVLIHGYEQVAGHDFEPP
ncbi:MAG: hypothetical protein ACAI44_20585 [Candidatus Sericytochromatia bacterium]